MSTATFVPTATLSFLSDLAAHNERPWFKANKDRYEREFVDPLLALIASMGPRIAAISPHFPAIPEKTGGSLMRIYRDTRFSKDATPYKTNAGIQFRHEVGKDVHAPGFYIHIEPGACFLGVGMWRPDSPSLRAIRDKIVAEPDAWVAMRDADEFSSRWTLAGDSLKRGPRDFDLDHPLIDDIKRKDFIATRPIADSDVSSPDFADDAARDFRRAADFMRFLCAAVSVPFDERT